MKRLLALAAFAVALAASAPAGACAADGDPCLNEPAMAKVTGQLFWDHNVDLVPQANEHERFTIAWASVYADYNHDGERQTGEPMVEIESGDTYTLPVDTLRAGTVDVRIRWSSTPGNSDTATQCLGPAAGCHRTVTVTAGETVRDVDFPLVRSETLFGQVWDDANANGRREPGEGGVHNARVFLDDNANGKLDPGELASRRAAGGVYSLQLQTRYLAAGGDLPPVVLEQERGMDCTAPADCAVTGLHVRMWGESLHVSHGVARPAVIFVHGYAGSQIKCGNRLLWFNAAGPGLSDMALGADSQCARSTRVDGLVESVLGFDIYGSSSRHFEEITWPGRHYDYIWDWRKTPEDALDGLDELVERVRRETGVAQVQLVAHSMGGLVVREYIDRPERAAKVARAVTIGTPYLGSVKSLFALVAGVQAPNLAPIDLFTDNEAMKAASRTFPGHFTLLPAFNYGDWLSVDGRRLNLAGIKDYMRSVGVDPALYNRALSEHGRMLDHYDDHGVDYQVIAGAGRPTIGSADLRYGVGDQPDTALVDWVSGDETVAVSAAAADVPRDRLHYVCDVKHVPITVADATKRLMDGFLIRAEPMRDEVSDCPWQARELGAFRLENLSARASQARTPRVFSGGKAYSLDEAHKVGLVQVLRFGGATKIVAMAGSDVRVELPAGGTATVRELSDRGAGVEKRFVGELTVALGGSGAVTRDGKPVKPAAKDTTPPRTTATLRHGKLVLRARDASKVAAIHVTIGGKRRVYRKPLRVGRKTVTYGSVDVWGNVEKPRKLRGSARLGQRRSR